jgi:hypothetical protein
MKRKNIVTIKLTPRAAQFFGALLCKIGGIPSGPRGEIVNDVNAQLIAQGIVSAEATMRLAEWRQYWTDENIPTFPGILANDWPSWSLE